ncbi:nucleotide-binding alpha-beta plait domain-containing protein [Tanacetum coccineum]|uniref:Nucleotide-binding alpha-beta plait domain-containing protein n=1 Tax=Tanacetum coccineum TaxID=301880 RepID=A0ABQ5E3S3_9ASTR
MPNGKGNKWAMVTLERVQVFKKVSSELMSDIYRQMKLVRFLSSNQANAEKGTRLYFFTTSSAAVKKFYSESKRNDHLDNNRRQEQHNKGIPNKSHPNFREEHKSFSSIFVSNIPWNASVQDLWDICNKWGVVIDVYIAAKRSKSGHRFGFVRFINVNDINQLVSNLRTVWMGGFHLFADVAIVMGELYNPNPCGTFWGRKYPSVVDMLVKYGTSNAGAESVECVWIVHCYYKERMKDVFWIGLVGLQLASWDQEVYKEGWMVGWEAACLRIWYRDDNMSHGRFVSLQSQGDCGNVTTDDNEDVTPVIAHEKDSISAPSIYNPRVMI